MNTETKPLEYGELVRLKSGSPLGTVVAHTAAGLVRVAFVMSDGTVQSIEGHDAAFIRA